AVWNGATTYNLSWRSALADDAEWMSGKSRDRLAPVLTEASSWTSDRRAQVSGRSNELRGSFSDRASAGVACAIGAAGYRHPMTTSTGSSVLISRFRAVLDQWPPLVCKGDGKSRLRKSGRGCNARRFHFA